MDLQLSNRVNKVKPSATLAITARASEMRAAGQDVIGLGAGEPDFDTPDFIKQAAIEAIHAGQTKYTPVDGTPELKQAVIDKFERDNGLTYQTNEVLVSSGGKQSFYNLTQALLNPGDEVIIPAPYWVSYPDIVILAGGVPKIVSASQQQNFKITADQLKDQITDKTRLFVINSPSNPTGMAYSEAELQSLADVLLAHPNILIATDDMYEHILWTSAPFCNIVTVCPELVSRSVVLNGVSKAYSMTGWRIGYCGGPAKLIAAMKKIQSQSTSNPSSISQAAAQAALSGDQSCIATMLTAFKARHDMVVKRLNQINNVTCLPSDGTFYCFPDIQKVLDTMGMQDDLALAEHLINAGVALVPGSAFGACGHIRISIATSETNLVNALDRIEGALPN